jgi:leader peptidase (prepilin peptidase)/N-methyltransferase
MTDLLTTLATLPRDLPPTLATFSLAVAFVFGALWGSFLNVVIARVPQNQSVVTPRSRCPHCGTMIAGWDNIPLVSWVVLRARCRHCGAAISARYPFVEFLGAVAGAAAVARFGWSLAALELFVFTLTLVAISFIDLDFFIVPTGLVIVLVVAGLGGGLLRATLVGPGTLGGLPMDTLLDRVIGAVAAGLLLGAVVVVSTALFRWLAPHRLPDGEGAMGWGDPLILVGVGAHVGWQLVPLVLFVASTLGSVVGITARLTGALKDRAPVVLPGEDPWTPPEGAIPFGPFLAIGGLVAAFFGDAILATLLPVLGLDAGGPLRELFLG